MAAEVVVVIEYEDAGVGPGGGAEEPSRRQAADAPTDNDEVVPFTCIGVGTAIPTSAVAQRVGHLE